LEEGLLEYEIVGEFLAEIKKELGGGDKETLKVVELKIFREEKLCIQEFRRAARSSKYEGRFLVEEFKREMNGTVC